MKYSMQNASNTTKSYFSSKFTHHVIILKLSHDNLINSERSRSEIEALDWDKSYQLNNKIARQTSPMNLDSLL